MLQFNIPNHSCLSLHEFIHGAPAVAPIQGIRLIRSNGVVINLLDMAKSVDLLIVKN